MVEGPAFQVMAASSHEAGNMSNRVLVKAVKLGRAFPGFPDFSVFPVPAFSGPTYIKARQLTILTRELHNTPTGVS